MHSPLPPTTLHRRIVGSAVDNHNIRYSAFACAVALAVQIGVLVSASVGTIVFQRKYATSYWMDVMTGFTVAALCVLTLVARGEYLARQVCITCLLSMWGLRLSYLHCSRAGVYKQTTDVTSLCITRTVWAWFVSVPAVLLNTLDTRSGESSATVRWSDFVGLSLAVAGMMIEMLSDREKNSWYKMRATRGADLSEVPSCLQSGLWAWSRHPNYAGQLTFHVGIYLLVAFHTPFWSVVGLFMSIVMLLVLEGGMRTHEQKKNAMFFGKPDYLRYRISTSPLVLLPPGLYSKIPPVIQQNLLFEWKSFAISRQSF